MPSKSWSGWPILVIALSLLAPEIVGGASRNVPTDFSCADVTEIPSVECEALVALYNGT